MGLWDGLAHATAQALAANFTDEQKQRGTALVIAKAAKPDADASDLMILANYVVTGFEIIPEPKDDPYPYPSGDMTVLGPGIHSSTTIPAENSVLSWRGENFVPQRDQVDEGYHVEIGGQRFTEAQWEAVLDYRAGSTAVTEPVEDPDDPGPVEPSGALPDIDPAEPAPMAGAHWRGSRGSRNG